MSEISFLHHYSDAIRDKKVAILGIVPPPLGGVSVHIQRVKAKLEAQHNIVAVFNTETRYRNWLFPFYISKLCVWLVYQRPQVVLYHSSYVTTGIMEIACLAYFKLLLHFSLVIVEHDCRHLYNRSMLTKRLYQHALKKVDKLVCIGDKTYASYCSAKFTLPAHMVEGAFLPPVDADKKRILAMYPPELFTFIASKKKIILANAAHCMRINDADVYGLDRCIDMMRDVKPFIAGCGLIIALAQEGDHEYFTALCDRINQYALKYDVFILLGNYELWPLFSYTHLFVRPTLSDGASISIQEALYYNVPVVASNVCARPRGVISFDILRTQSFAENVKNVLISSQKSL